MSVPSRRQYAILSKLLTEPQAAVNLTYLRDSTSSPLALYSVK